MKGQLVSLDFVAAIFIFLGIFTGLLISWDTIVASIEDNELRNQMQSDAIIASDVLVQQQGNPGDWNSANVIIPGLSSSTPNVLSLEKMGSLMELDYENAKQLLSITDDFFIELAKSSGERFTFNGNQTVYGIDPSNATDVVVIRRYVVVDQTIGVLTMRVWQ